MPPAQLPVPGRIHLRLASLTILADAVERPAGGWSTLLSGLGQCDALLSLQALKLPLAVRCRRPGDRFRPLGAPGAKKLKKFFIDRKVPRHQRDRIPLVVTADDRIAWVVGHAIAEAFKLTGSERRALRLRAASQP